MTSSDSSSTVEIRPLRAHDACQAAKIWVSGLQQTIDHIEDLKRKEEIARFFKQSAEQECSKGGCVGPNGEGLVEFWCYKTTAAANCRRMFVAVREDKVLGLVGVKRGMDYRKFPATDDDDYGTFSIWKMSVLERRSGIGRKLIWAVEDWVRQQDDTQKIRLYTGNPIAAMFYVSMGYSVFEMKEHYGVYEKVLQTP
jgi:GNAT superfamily N-acetyltransferase